MACWNGAETRKEGRREKCRLTQPRGGISSAECGSRAQYGANGQQAAPATTGDAPGPAVPGGQQAGPAELGLASSSSGQPGPAEKHQSAPSQQPPGGSAP